MHNIITIFQNNPGLLILIVTWSTVWKAIAVWHAARNNQLGWFIALFIINTIGFLEIIYLAFFTRRKL